MKKIISVIISLFLLAAVMSACSEKATTKTISDALAKTAALTSSEYSFEIKASVEADGVKTEMPITGNVKTSNKDDNLTFKSNMSSQVFGQTIEIDMYYSDGVIYMDQLGEKVKFSIPKEEAEEQIVSIDAFSEDMIKEFTAEKTDAGQKYTLVLDNDKLNDYVLNLTDNLMNSNDEEEENIKILSSEAYCIIDKDGYCTEQWMKFEIAEGDTDDETGDDSVNMSTTLDIKITYTNPGQDVTVEAPDNLSEYEDYSDFDIDGDSADNDTDDLIDDGVTE